MKTWGVVCGLLSGAILSTMLGSMHSCADVYDVGPEGQLFKMSAGSTPDAPLVRGAPQRWDEAFPRFPGLDRWAHAGDRLTQTRTTAGLWVFEVQMQKVELTKGEESILLARDGHVRFWATILGVSLFPLIAWEIAAVWVLMLRPPPNRQ
jgi:hypothetical protein